MPIAVSFQGLPAKASAGKSALDPGQVWFQYLCTTDDETGAHDPNQPPAARVRPSHACYHGTVWRIDDPRAPVPPCDYGCRCAVRYVGAPRTQAAKVLPVAQDEPTTDPAAPLRTWLDANIPDWKKLADAAGERGDLPRAVREARALGIRSPAEIARMAVEASRSPAAIVKPIPTPAPVVPTSHRAVPASAIPAQAQKEGQPPIRVTVLPPFTMPNVPPAAPDKVLAAERQILGRTVERMLIFTPDGALAHDIEGKPSRPNEVDWGQTLTRKNSASMIMTHNHPRGHSEPEGSPMRWGNSFSKGDWDTAISLDLAEMRAVTAAGITFSVQRPPGGWPSLQRFKELWRDAEDSVKASLMMQVLDGSLKVPSATALHFHLVAGKLAAMIGATYQQGTIV